MIKLKNIDEIENADSIFARVEQAKQQWEAAVDALPELICVVNDAGTIIRANRAIEDWTNFPVTEVEGLNLHTLIHPSCQQPCYLDDFWQNVKQEADSFSLMTLKIYDPVLKKHLHLRARRTGQGKWTDRVDRIFIFHDVTKQHQMEESLRENAKRFEVLNAISKSILIAQTPQQIANFALSQLPSLVPYSFACIISYDTDLEKLSLLGISGNEANEIQKNRLKDFSEVVSTTQDYLRHDFIMDNVDEHPTVRRALDQLSLGAMNSMWNSPLEVEGRFIGTLILADKKRNAFEQDQNPVVKEVAKLLTVSLRQAWLRNRLESSNENLQNLLRANQQQLQTVSHELRSPLGIIMGYTEMLHQGLLGPLTDDQQKALEILEKKGDQLLTLVQSLFTLKKVDSANLKRQDMDPAAFLHEIVDSWQVLAKNKEIKLIVDVEPNLPPQYVDKDLLTQVFSNLLDNAIKFSQARGEVTVLARASYSDLIFSVADRGKGIPAEKAENIFQRFYQVEKDSAQAKMGAGIGLALCHAIVTAHGGQIWVESGGENKGSTFFVSLPYSLSNTELAA